MYADSYQKNHKKDKQENKGAGFLKKVEGIWKRVRLLTLRYVQLFVSF